MACKFATEGSKSVVSNSLNLLFQFWMSCANLLQLGLPDGCHVNVCMHEVRLDIAEQRASCAILFQLSCRKKRRFAASISRQVDSYNLRAKSFRICSWFGVRHSEASWVRCNSKVRLASWCHRSVFSMVFPQVKLGGANRRSRRPSTDRASPFPGASRCV